MNYIPKHPKEFLAEANKVSSKIDWHSHDGSMECYGDIGFVGLSNGNYGNPTNYTHSSEVRERISKNNSRYLKGVTGEDHPAFGNKRPDNIKWMHKLWEARRGQPAWNKGKKLPPHTAETIEKMKGPRGPHDIVTCTHCNKTGGISAMKRWHFDNCKENK